MTPEYGDYSNVDIPDAPSVEELVKRARNEALEEAATLCDKCKDQHWGPLLAAAIRALKE